MTDQDAIALIAGAQVDGRRWADLGCGDGTFTRALASLLPPDSVIEAMDRDRSALTRLPPQHHGTTIATHTGDFTSLPWPFDQLDGVLMANALHYVDDQPGFLRACEPALARRRFLIVEYDTDRANPWVPYPLSRIALDRMFSTLGYRIDFLGAHPSIYRRAELYSALATSLRV